MFRVLQRSAMGARLQPLLLLLLLASIALVNCEGSQGKGDRMALIILYDHPLGHEVSVFELPYLAGLESCRAGTVRCHTVFCTIIQQSFAIRPGRKECTLSTILGSPHGFL